MRIGIHSSERNAARLIKYCRQIGVEALCLACSAIDGYSERGYPELETLRTFKNEVEKAGISVSAMIISRWPSQDVLLSKQGSEKELEALCLTLEILGKAGVSVVLIYPEVDRPVGRLREEECWRGIREFYETLVDHAERAGD